MNGKTAEKLLRKMDREYQEFREKLEKLPANLALEHAFEDLAKRDILFAIKEGTFDDKQAKALLKLGHIGVNTEPVYFEIPTDDFDDMRQDKTLKYKIQ